jgi:hypothetical protein
MRAKFDRRLFLAWGAAAVLVAGSAAGEEVVVPISLQVELLAKVATYDRNFAARAGDHVQVLVLTKAGDAQSARVAGQIQSSLGGTATVAGLPHTEVVATFTNGPELTAACRAKPYAIVFVTPGLAGDLAAISKALSGLSVLSVTAIPGYVPNGIVLGFDMISGKSKLLVNLTQARLQSVAFRAEMLKLMKVAE